MSDREKGLLRAMKEIFPKATSSYCCQHIANNVQQRHGNKCGPFFFFLGNVLEQRRTKILKLLLKL
jgi:hypothetical protein